MIERKLLKLFDKQIKSNITYYGGDLHKIESTYKLLLRIILPSIILLLLIIIIFKKFIFIPFLSILIFFIILYPLIYSWIKKVEYRRASDLEGPFFLILLYLNSLLDKGILTSLEEGSKLGIFKVVNKELQQLKKDIILRNISTRKALNNRAIIRKDDIFGKIYMNYLAAEDVGISIPQRMRELLQDTFNWIKENYENYLNFVMSITEGIFSIFILIPILLIAFQSVFSISLFQLLIPLALVPPIFLLISLNQPDTGHKIKVKLLDIIILFTVSILIFLIPTLEIKYKIYCIILAYTIFSIKYYLILRNNEKAINLLPNILKNLSDFYQIGHSIKLSMQKLDEKIYKLLRNTSRTNWIINYVLELLNIIENKSSESGNIINELNNILITINGIKRKLVNSLKLYSILNYTTPFILWFTFSMINPYRVTTVGDIVDIILISYSAALALLFTKISEFTILKPFHVLITSTISLLLTFIPPNLISLI